MISSSALHTTGLIILLAAASCACSRTDKNVIAEVYDAKLDIGELQRLQPGYETQDSFLVNPASVQAWIQKQVMLHAARTHLSSKEKNFERELQDYYNSLLINAYENKVVEQRLDKNVGEEEIKAYYNGHKSDFEMNKNIVQINYAKFPLDYPNLETVRSLLKKGKTRTPAEQEKLSKICYEEAENMYLDFNWIVFDDILIEIPIEPHNQVQFLKNNKELELKDSQSVYMVYFIDYKINETYSPIEIERENIRNIILRERRLALLQQLRKETLDKAYQEHEITSEFIK